LYPALTEETASHEYRNQYVLNEVMAMHPDIVCMQEMGHSDFHDYFQLHLARAGEI
jgi:mRNA deadenylase 3'-5' endonuclease subunit Ccr4